ncbi:hypothetical protein HXA35_06265 [Bacillus sp. A301a_S52]|nr:hypothetical protein [Bacillus sp. A301a_S52]
MDNYLLLAIVALKGLCLFFCWKSISVSKVQNKQTLQNNLSKEETTLLNEKMDNAIEQNRLLQEELQQLQENRDK